MMTAGEGTCGPHDCVPDATRGINTGTVVVRFELPFDVLCLACGESVAMGIRFNAERARAGGPDSVPLWTLGMRCPFCDNPFALVSDPDYGTYRILSGARTAEAGWDGHADPDPGRALSPEPSAATPPPRMKEETDPVPAIESLGPGPHAEGFVVDCSSGTAPLSGPGPTRLWSTDRNDWYRNPEEPSAICALTLRIGGRGCGSIGIRLFDTVVPRTCENFRRLCAGAEGRLQPNGRPYHYRGTVFTRLQRNRFIVGGNIYGDGPIDGDLHALMPQTGSNPNPIKPKGKGKVKGKGKGKGKGESKGKGKGKSKPLPPAHDDPTDPLASVDVNPNIVHGESVFGGFFDDESFALRHDRKGLLSTVRSLGTPNSNGSQFLITLGPVADLDGMSVVFGEVCYGLSLLEDLNALLTGSGGRGARKEGGSHGVGAGRPRELVSVVDSLVLTLPTASELEERREAAARQQAREAAARAALGIPNDVAGHGIADAVAEGLQAARRVGKRSAADQESTEEDCASASARDDGIDGQRPRKAPKGSAMLDLTAYDSE